jgi:hypothetical protein
MIWNQPRQVVHKLRSQKYLKQNGWQSASSGRAPAWQVWSPEFKPQYHPPPQKILEVDWHLCCGIVRECPFS